MERQKNEKQALESQKKNRNFLVVYLEQMLKMGYGVRGLDFTLDREPLAFLNEKMTRAN